MSTSPPPRQKVHTPNLHPHFPRKRHPMRPRALISIRAIDRHRVPLFEGGARGAQTFVARLEEVLVYSDVTEGVQVCVVEGRFAGGGGADE